MINAETLKPYVGDYDLMGVARLSSPGQNVALAASEKVAGEGAVAVSNVESPIVREVREALNHGLKEQRSFCTAQDQFAGYRGEEPPSCRTAGRFAWQPRPTSGPFTHRSAAKPVRDPIPRAAGPGGLGKPVLVQGGKK